MFKILSKINKSAGHAIRGLRDTFKEEFMCRVQFSFGLIQFLLGILFHFEFLEMVIIFMNWIFLISQENMNTGIENLADLVTNKEHHELAKRAKDSAGGSVFIISVMSWIIFSLFVIEKLI